jgi:hypothetical protein
VAVNSAIFWDVTSCTLINVCRYSGGKFFYLLFSTRFKFLPEGKRPLARKRRRSLNNIKMILREIGWSSMDWIDLAQGRDQWRALVNATMNIRVP